MSIPLSTPVDRVHFHPSISHCIFMCIVGSENMLLFLPLRDTTIYFTLLNPNWTVASNSVHLRKGYESMATKMSTH